MPYQDAPEGEGGVLPWSTKPLHPYIKITSGQSPSKFRFGAVGTPYFKVEQLGRTHKFLSRETTPYLSTDVPSVPEGSVVFAKRGAAIALNRVRLLAEPGFMDTNLMALTPTAGLDSEYLFYALLHRGLWDIADVTSVPQINNKHIKPLELPIPLLEEQRAIVAVLTAADEAVGSLERLISKKVDVRTGLEQQLLSGRSRHPGFSEPWLTTTLGERGIFLKGRGIRREDIRASGVSCIRYGELYTTYRNYTTDAVSHVDETVASRALPLRKGDLLFASSGETREEIGMCVAWLGERPAVAGGDIIVFRSQGVDSAFLASLMNTPPIASQKARMGQGDAVVHINSRGLSDISLRLPALDEQEAVAGVLSNADAEIRLLEKRLIKARRVKVGLMQELLSGRTRLPVVEPVPVPV